MSNFVYSKAGLKLTERFEECRLTAYQDIRGIWTIGWGHTGPDVYEGLVWTQEQADAQVLIDTQNAVNHVNRDVTFAINQNEFDALVDFSYNAGCGALAGSTLLKDLNAGNIAGAAAQFEAWDHAGGKVVAGLLRRRLAEQNEFDTPPAPVV
jgi:lysozyme